MTRRAAQDAVEGVTSAAADGAAHGLTEAAAQGAAQGAAGATAQGAAGATAQGAAGATAQGAAERAAGATADEWPMRDITDPRMLRAMAHPLRIKLLNQLALYGPATATELADRLHDSAPNCSWHLRQLAKFGLIEDLPGPGRNRPWRWLPVGNRWRANSPEMAQAAAQLTSTWMNYELDQLQAWEVHEADEPQEWRDAAFGTQTMNWLTAEELAEINKTVTQMLLKNMDRLADPSTRPPGARPVRFVAWGIPCDLS